VEKQLSFARDSRYDLFMILVSLLSVQHEPRLLERVLDVIVEFTQDSKWNQNKMMEAGGIVPVVTLLSYNAESGKTVVPLKAAAAVAAMASQNVSVSRQFEAAGSIIPLLKLLKHHDHSINSSFSRELLLNVSSSVRALCVDSAAQELVISSGGMELFVQVLQKHTHSQKEIQASLLATLTAIFKDNFKAQNMLRKCGTLETLIAYLSVDDVDVKTQSCYCLRELAIDNDKNQESMCLAGVAAPLANILVFSDPANESLMVNCVLAIWCLAAKKKRRKLFTKAQVVPALEYLSSLELKQGSKLAATAQQTLALMVSKE